MAKKLTNTSPKPDCKDCKHMTEPHSRANDGHWILCRCPFHKWSKFMTGDGCDKFERKI